MRPVDADALERKWRFDNEMVMVVDVTEIRNAPTIEAEPVRHGRRVKKGWWFACSLCDVAVEPYYSYCPCCGAKIEED